MSMIIISEDLQRKLEKVKKREWWPVASLAEILGRPRMYIYRHIESEDFCLFKDGSFKKVTSNSVVDFFLNHQNGSLKCAHRRKNELFSVGK